MFVDFHILNELGSPSINSNTFANRPSAGQVGRLFVSTDTYEIYRDNGTTWDLIGGPGSSTVTGTGTATQVAYWTASQSIGGSNNLWWNNTNGRLGVNTNTPGAALDIHSTGIIAQLNSTGTTNNGYLAFQRNGSGIWRIGDSYNGGNNFFELHNTVLTIDAMEFQASTNKSTFQAQETYTTGLARGNYFDYNLSVSAGGSFSTPNSISAIAGTLDLTLAGNATIPSGARSGWDAYNTISFTGSGTLTHNQGTQIRAYSNLTTGWAFAGSATGTITHLAGLRVLFPDNSGSAVTITNNYGLLINDQTANTGTVTYTNRWGVYQEGTSDLNYFAANTLIGTTTNSGEKLVVNGTSQFTNLVSITGGASITLGLRALQLPTGVESTINSGLSVRTGVAGESIVQFGNNLNTYYTGTVNAAKAGAMIRLDTRGVAPTPNASAYSVFQIQTRAAGTADPNYTVPVQIAAAPNGSFCIDTSGRGYFYNGMRVGASASAPTNALSVTGNVDASGSIGIGTTSPLSKLNISDGYITVGVTSNTSQTNTLLYGYGYILSGTPVGITKITSTYSNVNNGASLEFYTDFNGSTPTERMRITSGGNVGIGITSPTSYISRFLEVSNSTSSGIKLSGATSGLNVGVSIGFLTSDNSFRITNYETTGVIRLETQDTERMRLTAGGNVLIGTTTDAGYLLQVNGTASILSSGSTQLYLRSTGGGSNRNWQMQTNETVAGDLSFMQSTTAGGSTYSTLFNISNTGAIKTAAPTTGTAAAWKLGSRVAATVVVNTTEYIEVDIGGTLYKLATVT